MSRTNATPQQPIPNAQQAAREKVARENDVLAARRGITLDAGDGDQFTVRPMTTKQMFAFLSIARPIFAALAQKPDAGRPGLPQAADQGGTQTDEEPGAVADEGLPALAGRVDVWLGLFEENGPEVLRAIAVAVERNQDPEVQQSVYNRLEDIEVADLFLVIRHVVTCNVDFFKAQGLTLHDLSAARAAVFNQAPAAQ